MLVHTEAQLHLTRSFHMPWKLFRSDQSFFTCISRSRDARQIDFFVRQRLIDPRYRSTMMRHKLLIQCTLWRERSVYSRRYRQHSFFVLPRQLLSSSFISVRCESCTSSLENLRWNSLPLWHPVSFILSAFPISSLALWQIYFTRHDIW